MNHDEEEQREELERVLFRLSAIDNDARLEQVLFALLPKLLLRFEHNTFSKPKQVLVQIFNHVSRWVKSPSMIRLPIVDIAKGLKEFAPETEALRVSLLFIEIGFARSTVAEQHACLLALLDSKDKFVESLPQFSRLLFSVLPTMEIPPQHSAWVANLCVETCYAVENRVSAVEYLLRSKQDIRGELLLAGILCSSADSGSTATARLGAEAIKSVRDFCDSQTDNSVVVNRLFAFVLDKRTPAQAKPVAIDFITRYCKSLSESLCKVVISGLCVVDVNSKLRVATFALLQETAQYFPQTGPLDVLLSSALQKSQQFSSSLEQPAYLACLASWMRTRNKNTSTSWKAKHCLALLQPQFIDQLSLEPALHAILPKLAQEEVKSLASSSIVLRLAEEGVDSSASRGFRSFLIELAALAKEVDATAACWIFLMCQPVSNSKALVPVDKRKLDFDSMYAFAKQRDVFTPQVLKFLLGLLKQNSALVDDFVTAHVASSLLDQKSQVFACDAVVVLLTAGNTEINKSITWDWLKTNLQSSNALVRLAASHVVRVTVDRWESELTGWIQHSLSSTALANYEAGALLASGEFPVFALDIALAVEQWIIRKDCGEFTDLAFQSLTNLVSHANGELKNKDQVIAKAKVALKRSEKQGVVMFIGRVLGDYNLLLDELLLHTSDVKIPLQIATGVALQNNRQALKRVLEISAGEVSKRQRSSCAVVLEHIIKTESSGSIEVQAAFLTLLGEEEPLKLCCSRGLAQNYLQSDFAMRERLIVHLVRHFTVHTNVDRQLQELCMSATRAGSSALVFYFLAIVGGVELESFPVQEFQRILNEAPPVRLATQFIRRRHVDALPLVQKAAHYVYPTASAVKQALSNIDSLQSVYQDASRLLRDSFVLIERKSGLLTMVECLNHHGAFIAPPIETWRDVFRALDDLDDSITSHTSFGHCIKRLTLKEDEELESTKELFDFLLTNGLGSPVLKVRHLTRSFFMDAVASKRLPDRFAVRLIDALLRTIGESESAALQYAQFHTRGGTGTGELAVDAGKLEEIRCRLAVESLEYQAILKCTTKVVDFDSLFLAVSRVLKSGVGLATLASAVSYVQFLCSEESGVLASKDRNGVLLSALTMLLLRDQSVELKRRTLFAAGKLAKLSTCCEITRLAYYQSISDFYDSDPEQSQENRLLAALACKQVVDIKTLTPVQLVRPAFLGRYDEDKQVAEVWKDCWSEMRMMSEGVDLVQIGHDAIKAYSYRQRRQGAQALVSVDMILLAAKREALIQDLLKLISVTNSGGVGWDGKEIVIKCTGQLLQHVILPELVDYACRVLETCLFASEQNNKWILEALFQATKHLFSNRTPALKQQLQVEMELFVQHCNKQEIGDPLVTVSMLNTLRAIIPLAGGGLTSKVMDLIVGKVFTKQASWNVKVACLQVFESCDITLFPEEEWDLVYQLLEEEKKPSVLVALLNLVKRKDRVTRDARMNLAIQTLARHTDPAVSKLAFELQ